jgi:hypothetical protein
MFSGNSAYVGYHCGSEELVVEQNVGDLDLSSPRMVPSNQRKMNFSLNRTAKPDQVFSSLAPKAARQVRNLPNVNLLLPNKSPIRLGVRVTNNDLFDLYEL